MYNLIVGGIPAKIIQIKHNSNNHQYNKSNKDYKLHMISEHNSPIENSCAVCHINLINESSLPKHMEFDYITSVVVTSTTIEPVG